VTISKGSAYGEPGVSLPAGGVRCADDAAARREVAEARRRGEVVPVLGLMGGDLARTLGGHGELNVAYPVDLGQVLVDGRLHVFVAHCIVRSRTWSRVVAVGNAQWLGPWNVWPKGHPNDGKLEVLDASLPLGQRWQARRRLPSGTHIPHPGITQRRTTALTVELDHPLDVRCDGDLVGRGTNLVFRIEPDALRVVV
jgi:hypothetical protein